MQQLSQHMTEFYLDGLYLISSPRTEVIVDSLSSESLKSQGYKVF